MDMTIQKFLKMKIIEAGLTQTDVAERTGLTRQNLSYRLAHPNLKFSSFLLIAESIGLTCRIEGAENAIMDSTEGVIRAACNTEVSAEAFIELIESAGCKLVFDWKKPGDILYMYESHKNESET